MGQVHSYVEAFLPQEAWIPESRGVKVMFNLHGASYSLMNLGQSFYILRSEGGGVLKAFCEAIKFIFIF